MADDSPIYAVVPKSAPSAYWEGWWKEYGSTPALLVLKSGRTGSSARLDVEVLEGRLASGLHSFHGWRGNPELAFRLAIDEDEAFWGPPEARVR